MFVLYAGIDVKDILGCFTSMDELMKHTSEGYHVEELPVDVDCEFKCACVLCARKFADSQPVLDTDTVVFIRHKDFDGWNDKNEDCRLLAIYTDLRMALGTYNTPGLHHVVPVRVNRLHPLTSGCACSLCQQYAKEQEQERMQDLAAAEAEFSKAQQIVQTKRAMFGVAC